MAQGEASAAVVGRLGAPGVVVDGRYRLEHMLGAGGFGEVWSAVQEVEGAEVRPVALKLVKVPDSVADVIADGSSGGSARRSTGPRAGSRGSHGSSGSVGGQRWLDEVRAVRDIRCDAITTIFDVGIAREPRVGFIAMELLRGETLDDLLARRVRGAPRGGSEGQALYWRRSLAIARDVARALVACHAVGVVHCDLKPQNIFLDGSSGSSDGPRESSDAASRVYVLDFGIASLGEAVHAQAEAEPQQGGPGLFEMGATGAVTVSDMPELGVPAGAEIHVFGTPGYIAPENFRGDAPGPASDVFALGVLLYQMISGRLPHRVDASLSSSDAGKVASELSSASPNSADSMDRGNSAESARRYQAALSAATVAGDFDPLDIAASSCPAGVRDLVDQLLDPDPEKRPVADLLGAIERVWRCPHGVPDPPYVGLAAFDASRAGYIAGRDADIDELAAALEHRRVVVLAGPSGCGKSSLALAGVAARVDEHLVLGKDGWRTLVVRPSQGADVIRVCSSGTANAEGREARDEHVGTVVVVDQLEELLRLEESERNAFCDALASLVEGVDASAAVEVAGYVFESTDAVRVIATCRDDLFGQVASIPALRRFPERNLYTVRGVEPNAMSSIVEAPARAAGYRLEDGAAVVTEAVRIVRADPGALPLVQFALTRWWDARDLSAKVLPASVWREIGGIEGALSEAAQTLYDGFNEVERDRMRALLLAMFRPDGTRVRVAETAVVTDSASRAVLSLLVQRRLVTRHTRDSHDDAGSDDASDIEGTSRVTLEVVHEALGRRWPLLHAWLEETRSEREILHDLAYDEGRWKHAGKPEDLLWRGARLEAAVELRARRVVGLERGAEFLDTSVAAEGKQTWRRRGFAGLLVAVVAVAVVMVLSYLGSNRERQRARDQQSIAEAERAKAEESRRDAEEALARNIGLRQDAERAGREALEEKKRADAARLAAVAAREQAQAEAAKNDELRQAAEASQSEAQEAMHQAQAERIEADRQRQLNREAAQVAEKQRRQAEAQKKYAETAQRLHELARERMERIEADYDRARAERKILDRKLRRCLDRKVRQGEGGLQ